MPSQKGKIPLKLGCPLPKAVYLRIIGNESRGSSSAADLNRELGFGQNEDSKAVRHCERLQVGGIGLESPSFQQKTGIQVDGYWLSVENNQ